MIEKIISGGQTGADQGALDAAIKLDIPHGGWIPKGRLTEDGELPQKYKLKEMSTASYPKRTEQNVKDSDGTLILTHGKLTGGSKLTKEFAVKNGKAFLHIDLNHTIPFNASREIINWIREHDIRILNVAGTRASENPRIHDAAMDIIEAVCYLGLMDSHKKFLTDNPEQQLAYPETIKEAIERLISELTLKDRTTIANMTEEEVMHLKSTLGLFIEQNFGLISGNRALIESCKIESPSIVFNEDDACEVILRALWQDLQQSHTLRIVK